MQPLPDSTPSDRTTPIRVVRIITRLNIGGPAIQAITLSHDLAQQGFETCLVHGHLAEGEGDMTSLLPLGNAEAEYVDVLVRPVSPLRDLVAIWRVYRILCRWQPRIIHTHMAKAGTVGRVAGVLYNRTKGRRQPAHLVHTYHGHVFEGYFSALSTKVFLAVERWLARRTDALIAISFQIKQDLLQTFKIARPDQVVVIPLGFDLSRLLRITAAQRSAARTDLEIPAESIVVSTVGRLTEIKQHQLFLEMAALLVKRSPRFLFLITGDGELRAQLEQSTTDLGIARHVRFLGWRGDLETVYGASDVFVLTSRNEGTPVALIEAMAAGVPAVSTAVGGVRDVIASEDMGVLIPFGDAVQLAAAVEQLANSPGRRADICQAARAFVAERFQRTRLISDISDLYWRLLGIRTTIH